MKTIRVGLRSVSKATLGLLLVLGSLLLAGPGRAQSAAPAVEYRVKAAYLYNFTKFIDWPPHVFAQPEQAFVFGVVDPQGTAYATIRDVVAGKSTIGGRVIEVRRLDRLDDRALECHQIFVTRASGVTAEEVRRWLNGHSILVVGETDNFAAEAGTIGLVLSGDAVRCEVNLASAERADLKLSGRLASISRLVREAPRR